MFFSALITLIIASLVLHSECQYGPRNYSTNTTIRRVYTSSIPVTLGSNRYRYECMNLFPQRSDVVPNGVIFTGFVEDIKQDGNDDFGYMATVRVRRVFLGPINLRKSQVIVTGFGKARDGSDQGNPNWCHSNVKRGESWIFVLQPISYPDYFRLASSLIKVTLNNLERIEGIAMDTFPKLSTVTNRKSLL